MGWALLVAAVALLGCSTPDDPVTEDAVTDAVTDDAVAGGDVADDDALADLLAEGGLVIYLRHTATTTTGVDDLDTLGDCDAQRELSAQGRDDARAIGTAFDRLDVPVQRVVASPFCRTVDSAELAFGDTDVDEALLALATADQGGPELVDRITEAGRSLIGTVPEDGTNLVLVGQLTNVEPITGTSLAWGEAALFRPDGDGEVALLATVELDRWRRLAAG